MIKLFCQHNYIILQQFDLLSEVELLSELGLKPNTHTSFAKKYVTDFKCEKCGKLKRLIVKF